MTTYTTPNLELTEFVGTASTTITITPDVNSSIYIENVTCNQDIPDLVITTTSDSFTFSSQFRDMFARTIKYTMQDSNGVKSFGSVSRFVDLPSTYKGVYEYVAPSAETVPVAFSVNLYTFTGAADPLNPELPIDSTPPWGTESPVGNPLYDSYKTTETWTLIVRQNWQASIAALKTAVSSGSGYAQAITKYPELEL